MNIKLLSDYEDIVQEAVYKYGDHPWIKRIIKHKALNFMRNQKKQVPMDGVDVGYEPNYDFNWWEFFSDETKCCYDKLTTLEKKIVDSKVNEEDTFTKIGAKNNISKTSAHRIYDGALKKLKNCLNV